MIINHKNEGEKIAFELEGTRLYLGDDEMMLNLSKLERDYPVHLDICRDENGILVMSVDTALRYVAEIDIPAARYTEPEATATEGGMHDADPPVKLPIDTDKVTLTLWAV